MVCTVVFCAISTMIVWSSVAGFDILDCNRQLSTFRVSNTDVNGRTCSDEINVMSCWGRCDSNEVYPPWLHTTTVLVNINCFFFFLNYKIITYDARKWYSQWNTSKLSTHTHTKYKFGIICVMFFTYCKTEIDIVLKYQFTLI